MNNLFAINAYITDINQDDVTIKLHLHNRLQQKLVV